MLIDQSKFLRRYIQSPKCSPNLVKSACLHVLPRQFPLKRDNFPLPVKPVKLFIKRCDHRTWLCVCDGCLLPMKDIPPATAWLLAGGF